MLSQLRRRIRPHEHPWIFWLGVLAAIAGACAFAFARGTLSDVVGPALLGLAALVLVSWAFLLIGEGEERDRLRHPRG
jgi:drug/metabolite transporter (DMT)-like permease